MEILEIGSLVGISIVFVFVLFKLFKKSNIVVNPTDPNDSHHQTNPCKCYRIYNMTSIEMFYGFNDCSIGYQTLTLEGEKTVQVCSSEFPVGDGLMITECDDICG